MDKKIRVAFIKFGGLSAGGTEKFLQTVAANLNKSMFTVDFFYCDTAPYIGSSYQHPGTDSHRKQYMIDHHVNLIEFHVEAKDVTSRTHDWAGTNFWQVFSEENYDIIQTGRAGHPEYPFCNIRRTPIVDSIHFLGGVDNQYNISRVMHITKWSAQKWKRMGGDARRVALVSHPMEIGHVLEGNLREELGLGGAFVFGFHQRNADDIFSPIPLNAYKAMENRKTAFVVLGGGEEYRLQAKELGLSTVHFLDHTADKEKIYTFLQTLDVYAHGRKDGEVNSTAMAEAMYFGLPIVSHISKINNGHVECVKDAGRVVNTPEEYQYELERLLNDDVYRDMRSQNARIRFQELYELTAQMKHIEDIYKDVIRSPYPLSFRRRITSFRIKYFLVYGPMSLYRRLKNYLLRCVC